ncbi:MAG: tRNA adenosine(34) deaminase TadA [Verrucomicrobiota bacterium]
MNPSHHLLDCPFAKLTPSELNRDDAYYMSLAYNQAINAWREDEVPVGAVIVHQGQVIASSYNQVEKLKDPTAHAEMLAISQAATSLGDWRLNEAELYVTKEPCPMCSGASVMSRLSRVIYAVKDAKMGLLGGAASIHEIPTLNHHLMVTTGILEKECLHLLQAYFQLKRSKSPISWN